MLSYVFWEHNDSVGRGTTVLQSGYMWYINSNLNCVKCPAGQAHAGLSQNQAGICLSQAGLNQAQVGLAKKLLLEKQYMYLKKTYDQLDVKTDY